MNRLTHCLIACSMIISAAAVTGDAAAEDLAERVSRIEEQLKGGQDGAKWSDRISFSGSIEAEASYDKMDFSDPEAGDEDSSDINLSTVELGVDVDIAKYVKGNVLFLYEDDEDVVVDEGYILIDGGDDLPLYLKIGKIYVPFGNFETNMISDPLTLEWAETRESAAEFGGRFENFYASGYIFNGEVDKDGDESQISNFGLNVGYAVENDGFSLDMGVGYINSIVDSNGWQDILEEENQTGADMGLAFAFRDYVPGVSVHAVLGIGDFKIIGEYITMVEDPEWNVWELEDGALEAAGYGPVYTGERLKTWNAELGYTSEIAGKETTFGVAWQGTENGEEFFPEDRYMGVVNIAIFDETTLSFEYRHDKYLNDDEADGLTAKLAIGF